MELLSVWRLFGCANLTFSESSGLIIKLGTTSRSRELCTQKEFRNVGLEFSGIEIVGIWRFMHSFAHRNVCRKSVKLPPPKIFVEAVVSFVEKDV